jgi:hypothetical protein
MVVVPGVPTAVPVTSDSPSESALDCLMEQQPARTISRWMGVVHGVILILSALAIAPIAWFALSRIAYAIDRQDLEAAGFAATWIDHPYRAALLALPALACGILMVSVRFGKWIWFVLGMSCLIVIVALVLYCFITMLGPLYTPQEL